MSKNTVRMGACLALLAAATIAGCGDGKDSASDSAEVCGRWEGTITEFGKSTRVGLHIRPGGGGPTGEFSILSRTGGDIDQGQSFPLADIRESGTKLAFLVLLLADSGDTDNLLFDLELTGGKLVGHARENRSGSEKLPVTFVRVD